MNERRCCLDGCERKHVARGYCKYHYYKLGYSARERTSKRSCNTCGNEFNAANSEIKRGRGKFCSLPCFVESRRKSDAEKQELERERERKRREKNRELARQPKPCIECGAVFSPRNRANTVCSDQCLRARRVKWVVDNYRSDPSYRDQVLARAHARRADKLGLASSEVLLDYLIKRDRRRCGICHKPVRAKRGPWRASIDHIVPLNRGGTHDLTNVQLSHYRCNLAKGDRGENEQLLLFG